MIDKDMLFLQDCMDLLKVEPGSDSEMCHDHDECQFNSIKAEEVTAKQEEVDPLLIQFPVVKPEHDVSYVCMYTLLDTFLSYPALHIVFVTSICLSICMKHLHSSEKILKNSFKRI
jgi:hypothetical protein